MASVSEPGATGRTQIALADAKDWNEQHLDEANDSAARGPPRNRCTSLAVRCQMPDVVELSPAVSLSRATSWFQGRSACA